MSFKVDSFWVNGKRMWAIVDYIITGKETDTIIYFINVYELMYHKQYTSNKLYSQLPVTATPPVDYQGVAVLSYYVDEKRYFLPIDKFVELPDKKYK
jgi:hypothetical protein